MGVGLFVLIRVLVGWISGDSLKNSIKQEMKSTRRVDITDINLAKSADGGLSGTATASNGDVYDLQVDKPGGSRQAWTASPSKKMLEREISTMMAKSSLGTAGTIDITKTDSGGYVGSATTSAGDTYEVFVKPSTSLLQFITVIPSQQTITASLTREIESRTRETVRSVELTRIKAGEYTGAAVLSGGGRLDVTTAYNGTKVSYSFKPSERRTRPRSAP